MFDKASWNNAAGGVAPSHTNRSKSFSFENICLKKRPISMATPVATLGDSPKPSCYNEINAADIISVVVSAVHGYIVQAMVLPERLRVRIVCCLSCVVI